MMNKNILVAVILTIVFSFSYLEVAGAKMKPMTSEFTVTSADGVKVYGYKYFDKLNGKTPIVMLFHQAGSNAHGEYGELIPWLNQAGFRVIAWDFRAGGKHFGSHNKTVAELAEGTPKGYCDTYPDMQAALDYVVDKAIADKVFVWGSSYSAALVVQLAAKNPDRLAGVAAFSPATGAPMKPCRAHFWANKNKSPLLLMRPKSEMKRPAAQQQYYLFKQLGATVHVIEHGVHGSSMLVDSRTNNDMTKARAQVINWLKEHSKN